MKGFSSSMDNQLPDGVVSHIEGSLLYLADPVEEPGTASLHEPPLDAAGWPGRSGRYYGPNSRCATDNQRALFGQTGIRPGWRSDRGSEFLDEHEVRTVYYPEVERLIKRAMGAVKVVVFAHDVRSILKARAGEKGVREPVAPVHNDYTIKSGPEHMREPLGCERGRAAT
jgi:hypothetical protein